METASSSKEGSNLKGLFSNVSSNKKRKQNKESLCLSEENDDENVPHFIRTFANTDDIYDVSKKLVRIEYPGNVQNMDKAIETLGRLDGIQQAVLSKTTNKLQLRFHPDNPYNKAAVADRNSNAGILLKVTCESCEEGDSYSFQVVGVTAANFIFNKACDYQFLPLVVNGEELPEVKANNLFEQILPEKLPSLNYLLSPESKNMEHIAIPAIFSRFETSLSTLYLNVGEKYSSSLRPEMTKFIENSYEGNSGTKRRQRTKTPFKRLSTFVDFSKPETVVIPEGPVNVEDVNRLIKERGLESDFQRVESLFKERPIWTKAAVMHRCKGLSFEHSLILLPAVAYFCVKGPWRMAWIRLGYNPLTDYNSRIYQTLDYRIRTAEGTQLKVNPKRNYAAKTVFYLGPSDVQRISLKENMQVRKDIDENTYTLRVNTIPPARQMFYQFCDILVPEVQDMLNRLPKTLAQNNAKADGKCGWLPSNFTEQCREIVNEYILRNVQEELLKDLEKEKEIKLEKQKKGFRNAASCSQALEDVKQRKSVVPDSIIVLPDDESVLDDDGMHQVNASTLIANALPEQLQNNEEEQVNDDEDDSEMEIDEEAAMEVNKIIYNDYNDEEVNEITNYLKNHVL